MLTKSQLAERISASGAGGKKQILHVLDALAEVAADEVAKGEDFVVPGVARLVYRYRKPLKKGEKYRKGDTVVGMGGAERVAEEDSKPVTEKASLKSIPTGLVARLKPGSKVEDQKEFFKSKAGKNVRARKAK